jgi:hypothetical protein
MQNTFLSAVRCGLERKSVTTCARWAEKYRIMGPPFPGPWRFTHHPWAKEMHNSEAEVNVGQKSAQAAYTETCLNRVFYVMDIHNLSCMYVFPAKRPDAADFSASRFDSALELSEHLRTLFSDVKNIGHKRAGTANLYLRGSKSRSGLKSVPAGLLIFDEVDEMAQENIPLAFERQSGQLYKQTWMISTPTIPSYGINKYFEDSTKEHFHFPCPLCSRHIELRFPESIVIIGDDPKDPKIRESYLKCPLCEGKLPHATKPDYLGKGIWVPENPGRIIRGFHVNQLYSCTVEPYEIATSYLNAQTNPADEQEFYNSKLGLPHIVEGGSIDIGQVNACVGQYKNGDPTTEINKIITVGIDVGKWLHYIVTEWTLPDIQTTLDINVGAKAKHLEIGKVLQFEELDNLLYRWRPSMSVIDANPERRKAYEFAVRFWGNVFLCFYGNNVRGKQITLTEDLEQSVTVDRTSWLDLSLGRYIRNTVQIPKNFPYEFGEHITNQVRKYEKDKSGNAVAKYITVGADHWGHACNYSEIALAIAVSIANNMSVESPR